MLKSRHAGRRQLLLQVVAEAPSAKRGRREGREAKPAKNDKGSKTRRKTLVEHTIREKLERWLSGRESGAPLLRDGSAMPRRKNRRRKLKETL